MNHTNGGGKQNAASDSFSSKVAKVTRLIIKGEGTLLVRGKELLFLWFVVFLYI